MVLGGVDLVFQVGSGTPKQEELSICVPVQTAQLYVLNLVLLPLRVDVVDYLVNQLEVQFEKAFIILKKAGVDMDNDLSHLWLRHQCGQIQIESWDRLAKIEGLVEQKMPNPATLAVVVLEAKIDLCEEVLCDHSREVFFGLQIIGR